MRLDGDRARTFPDVRTASEFEVGLVPGAYDVPRLEWMASGAQPDGNFLSVVQQTFTQGTNQILGCEVGSARGTPARSWPVRDS